MATNKESTSSQKKTFNVAMSALKTHWKIQIFKYTTSDFDIKIAFMKFS